MTSKFVIVKTSVLEEEREGANSVCSICGKGIRACDKETIYDVGLGNNENGDNDIRYAHTECLIMNLGEALEDIENE